MAKKFGILLVAMLLVACGDNYTSEINTELAKDPRNSGIEFSLKARGDVLTFDLRSVSGERSMADVTRVLFSSAEFVASKREEPYKEVLLSKGGEVRFKLGGSDFHQLGKSYASGENPVYLMRTLPEKLKTPTDGVAYQTWTGGVLGVTGKQMEDFNDFHQRWYIND